VVEKEAIILHKITKSRSLFSCDTAETYCFPDIFKGAGLIAETDPKETRSSFQRVYIDVASGLPGESSNGNFRTAGFDERKKMQGMILEAQQKEAEAYQKGIQDGHQDGRKAGFAEGLKEIETVLHSLQQSIQEIKKLRKALCLKAEKEIVSLSLAIARKIMVQEPATNPKVIAGVVKKTFETIAINAPIRIRINPSELAYMRERRHLIPMEGDVTFIEDASISCGGCMVESLSGEVDARIESQLEMIEEAFLPGLAKNNQELEELF
jgi:flagellar biosynthesis/type III secretory pathway protein FliH